MKTSEIFCFYASSVKWIDGIIPMLQTKVWNARSSICWKKVPNISLFFRQIKTPSEPWRHFYLWLHSHTSVASHPPNTLTSFTPSVSSITSDKVEVLWNASSYIMWCWIILPAGQKNFRFFSLPLTASVLRKLWHFIFQRILLQAD